jgi:hypothetical protein
LSRSEQGFFDNNFIPCNLFSLELETSILRRESEKEFKKKANSQVFEAVQLRIPFEDTVFHHWALDCDAMQYFRTGFSN